MSARPMSGMGVMSPPPSAAMAHRGGMAGGGASSGAHQYQPHPHPQHQGHMRAAMPHSAPSPGPPPPPASNAPPGSLLPGTLVRVGPYTVTVKRYLSQGGFATVYLCVTDKPVAIPVVDITGKAAGSISETTHVLKRIVVPDKEALAEVRKEVEVHKLLRHDASVVHFLEASALSLPPPQQGYEVYILMEFCAGGGLLDLLNSRLRNRLAEAEVLTIFADICKGVAAMHHLDPPVLHRDLKIENILLANSTDPRKKTIYKLCDFGSAKPILSRRAPRSTEELKRLEMELNKTTTLPYRPPEMVDVYQRKVIDEKADIWALGVLLYKLCYYTTPFEENGGGPLAILNVKYRFPANPPYSDRVKGLIASILVEPSSRRPSIDDLLITVHKLLGLPPPASATHYAQLAKEGKQASALPQPMAPAAAGSRSSTASPSAAAPHRRAVDDAVLVTIAKENSRERASVGQGRPLSTRGDLRPTATLSNSSRQSQSPVLPSRSKDDSADLISFQPSQRGDKASSAAESERLMKLEGVTPMRRGRPAASSSTPTKAAIPGEGIGKLNLDSFGLKNDTPVSSPRPPSASQQKAVPISIDTSGSKVSSRPSSSAKVGNLIDGFGDSFAPDMQPPVAGTTAQGALTTPLSTSEAERKVAEFVRRGEEASSSPMVLSPALPGLNGASSPLGPLSPLPPLDSAKDSERRLPSHLQDQEPEDRKVSLAQSEGTAAAGRFPSLEELDRRYPSPPKIVTPKPDATSSSADKRESMAALASKFGGLSTNGEREKDRPTPALPPRKPWQSKFDDAGEKDTSGRGHRFEAKEDASHSYRSPARFSGTSPDPSKVKKEETVQTTNGRQAATENKKQEDSSDEEDEGPESIEGGVAAARKRWGGGQWAQDVQQAPSSSSAETTAGSDKPGKVKQPDWVRRPEEEPQSKPTASSTSKDEKPRPLLPSSSKPLIDFDGGRSRTMSASPAGPPAAAKEEAPEPAKSTSATTAQSRAPAWEWDADEADADEMRALARPRLDARLDSEAGGGLLGRLVDVNEESRSYGQGPASSEAPIKASSSNPLEERSASLDVPPLPLRNGPEPSKQTSTDSTRSATSGLPSRQRLAMGKVYSDAATSPAVLSPSPTVDSSASAEPISSPPPMNRPSSPSKGQGQPSSMLYEEPKKYAPGTAQSMASRWESMKSVGPAGAPKEEHRRTTSGQGAERIAVQPRRETTDSSTSTSSYRASIPSSSSSTNGAPQIIRPMPSKPPSSAKPRFPPSGPASSLKPWEREAAERAEADKSSHVRSSSYTRGAGAQEEEEDEEADTKEPMKPSATFRRNGTSSANASGLDLPSVASAAAASSSSPGASSPGAGAGMGAGGDTQRYRSVASLIDKWQANAKSTRPETGWGEIGAGGGERRGGEANELAAAAAARARMPGREV